MNGATDTQSTATIEGNNDMNETKQWEVWYSTKEGGESVSRVRAATSESAAKMVIGRNWRKMDLYCGLSVHMDEYGPNGIEFDGDWVYDTWQDSMKRNERRSERRHEQRLAAINAKYDERKRLQDEEARLSTAEWTKRFLAGELVGQSDDR